GSKRREHLVVVGLMHQPRRRGFRYRDQQVAQHLARYPRHGRSVAFAYRKEARVPRTNLSVSCVVGGAKGWFSRPRTPSDDRAPDISRTSSPIRKAIQSRSALLKSAGLRRTAW